MDIYFPHSLQAPPLTGSKLAVTILLLRVPAEGPYWTPTTSAVAACQHLSPCPSRPRVSGSCLLRPGLVCFTIIGSPDSILCKRSCYGSHLGGPYSLMYWEVGACGGDYVGATAGLVWSWCLVQRGGSGPGKVHLPPWHFFLLSASWLP